MTTVTLRALKEALKRLALGCPLLIFPQGGRDGSPEAAKNGGQPNAGIGFLAVKSGAPVIPVRLFGTDKVLPRGAKWFRRHPVKIVFGKPLRFSRSIPYPQVAEQIMTAVQELL